MKEPYVRCCERTAVNHRLLLDYQNEVSNMGFFSWLGFGKPRDATKYVKTIRPSLPEITDNVHDSWQILLWHDKLWGACG